jgi:large subunit ribosomal protein L6
MSRIGKTPIEIPQGVTITKYGGELVVKGPKGELRGPLPAGIDMTITESVCTITAKKTDTKSLALHGFTRAMLFNLVKGVTVGWTKTLELVGVGFRATVTNGNLVLTVGFSHEVTIVPPAGITCAVVEGKIIVSGIDKQLVGQVAANIRDVKKPEPYKGKGIKYLGEHIRKKAGKSAKAIGGAGGGAGAAK